MANMTFTLLDMLKQHCANIASTSIRQTLLRTSKIVGLLMLVFNYLFNYLLPCQAQTTKNSQARMAVPAATVPSVPSSKHSSLKHDVLWKKLETDIQSVDRSLDAVLGVAVVDLTDGRVLMYNADEVFPAASVIKLAVLAELFRQHEQGSIKLVHPYIMNAADLVPGSEVLAGLTSGVTTLTLRDLAHAMLYASDNAATNVLIDRLGMQSVNAMLERAGTKETRLRRKMLDLQAAREGRENTTTPRELTTLLASLWNGTLISKSASDEALQMLACAKDCYMKRLLPDNVVLATKPGSLEGVRAEAGIIYATERPFALAVMTAYAADEQAAERAISEVALRAYQLFERLGRSSPYGRVISPR
jgi:beta-lactamase class A